MVLKDVKKGKFTSILAIVLCIVTLFAYTDVSSAGTSVSKVKNARIKTIKVTLRDDGNVAVKWSKATGNCGISKYVIYTCIAYGGKFHAAKTVSLSKKKMDHSKNLWDYPTAFIPRSA